jgi:hypothetical protein
MQPIKPIHNETYYDLTLQDIAAAWMPQQAALKRNHLRFDSFG